MCHLYLSKHQDIDKSQCDETLLNLAFIFNVWNLNERNRVGRFQLQSFNVL